MSSSPPRLEGKVTDYGGLVHVEQWWVKGRRLRVVLRVGAPRKTTAADRTPTPGAYRPHNGRTDWIMDLQADKQVSVGLGQWFDEADNPTSAPADAVAVYTVDNTAVIGLADLGGNTAEASALGPLGVANVHADITWTGGMATSDGQLVVVPGDAVRVEMVFGTPEEVTPDV